MTPPGGRPVVGTPINVRLDDKLLAQLDGYAKAEEISRAAAVRQLLERGLRRRGKR